MDTKTFLYFVMGIGVGMMIDPVCYAIEKVYHRRKARVSGDGCPDWRTYLQRLYELGGDNLE